MRHVSLTTLLSLSILAASPLIAQEPGTAGVPRYELVSEHRVSPHESYLTYRAILSGGARGSASLEGAVGTRNASAFTVVSDRARLRFSSASSRSRATRDTFTLRVDPTVTFNLSDLEWTIVDPQAPIASAGHGRTVKVGETVFLDAYASSDPSAQGLLTYRWSVTRPDGSAVVLTEPSALNPSFAIDQPGEYDATLTVTNASGISAVSRVRYSTRNSAPVAHAGASQTVVPGATAFLDAARSWDPDGNFLTFHWSLVAMPEGSHATLLDSDTVSPRLRTDRPGAYLARLVVNDGTSDSAPAFVAISTENTAPVANAGAPRIASAASVVNLNGTASTDVDGDSLAYEWTLIAAPAGSNAALIGRSLVNPQLVLDLPGTYVAQLKVNDGRVDGEPATVVITSDATLQPVALAEQGRAAFPGAPVRLTGSSIDPQGLPVRLQWALTSRPNGSRAAISDPLALTPSFVADLPGSYTAQLMAHNGILPGSPSTVRFASSGSQPIAALEPSRRVTTGMMVTLDSSASYDADGHPLQQSWAMLTRPANSHATLSGTTGASPTFTPDVPGAYVVQLIVNDGSLNSAPATVFFDASPLTVTTTSLPVALVGVPYSVTLTASGGTPPYTWSLARGRLPGGFSLDPSGLISGAAQFTDPASIVLLVTDSASQVATAQFGLSIIDPVLTIITTSLPSGQKNVPYSQPLVAVGGTPPYTWSIITGVLPAGWSLNPSSGLISGVATTAVANSRVTFRVTDSAVPQAFNALGITLNVADAALAISTSSLPNGQAGVPYSATLIATGAVGALTWQVVGGTLPSGLSLNAATGAISGTPLNVTSPSLITFQVTDAGTTLTAIANLSIAINSGSLTIVTSSLPNAAQGIPYSFNLTAAGGTGALTWQLTAGTLPSGLSLNSATGQISGTPSATVSATPLTFKVSDSASASASVNLILTVAGGSLAITTTALPDAFIGLPYSFQLTAAGGAPPYFWSIASGRLPGGFTFDGSTGTIGGSAQFTDPASVVFRVTDSGGQSTTANLSIAIHPVTFSIVTTSLPNGQVGVPYSFQLQGIGGVAPYTWLSTSGGLPGGLFLNPSSGLIGGTPIAASSSRVTFRLTDSSPTPQFVNASLTLNITGGGFAITTASLPPGSVGVPYSQTLTAVGGSGALTWQLTSGALPAGLSLNPATGAISGTPSAPASASLTVKVTDSNSPVQTASASFTLSIAGPALAVATASLPAGTVGTPYSLTLAATGGTLPYSWQLTGGILPAGLVFSPSGQISGTPMAAAAATSLTFKVTDGSSQTASATLSLTIGGSSGSSLTITTTALPSAIIGVPYAFPLSAAGGTPPYAWKLSSGRLPGGFTLSSDGVISGLASPSNQPDGFLDPLTLFFQVTDSSTPAQSANTTLVFTMSKQQLQILTGALPTGLVGVPYSFALQASGGGSGIYTWALASGALPSGLSLDPSTGLISGIPSVAMARRVVISVTDPAPPPQVIGGSLQTVSASYTLSISSQ